jgi:hypothetical protein
LAGRGGAAWARMVLELAKSRWANGLFCSAGAASLGLSSSVLPAGVELGFVVIDADASSTKILQKKNGQNVIIKIDYSNGMSRYIHIVK